MLSVAELIWLVCHGFPPKPASDGNAISTAGSRVSRDATRYSGSLYYTSRRDPIRLTRMVNQMVG